jgi:hypothetical protein
MLFPVALNLSARCVPPFLDTYELRLAAAVDGGWDGVGVGGVGLISLMWWSRTWTVEKGLSHGRFPSSRGTTMVTSRPMAEWMAWKE